MRRILLFGKLNDVVKDINLALSEHFYNHKSIPVIFLTGISDKAHIQAVVNLKPQGYLLKPPTRDTLMAAIGKWI